MYDGVLALSERIVYQHSITGVSPVPQGNTHPLLCPYGAVPTTSGFVALGAPSDRHWRELAEIIGRPELGTDARFATNAARLQHAGEVYELIGAWSSRRDSAEVVGTLAGRVPCGPVNTAADIAVDPHVAARDLIVSLPHPGGSRIDVVGSAIKLTESPTVDFRPAPLLGEHTDEVLRESADGQNSAALADRPADDGIPDAEGVAGVVQVRLDQAVVYRSGKHLPARPTGDE